MNTPEENPAALGASSTKSASTTKASAATAAAEAAKRTITITFGDKESAVFDKIVKDAEADDRTEAKYLAIWLRDNYESPAE